MTRMHAQVLIATCFLLMVGSPGATQSALSPGTNPWRQRYVDAIGERDRVQSVIRMAGRDASPGAREFLEQLAWTYPGGSWSHEALVALALDPGSGFPALALRLAGKLPRRGDKIKVLGMLEESTQHRRVGLQICLENLLRHRNDTFGIDLLTLIQRYIHRPSGTSDLEKIAAVLMAICSSVDRVATSDPAFKLAGTLPPEHRNPFLVSAVESMDPHHVVESARILLEDKTDGIEELLVESIVSTEDEATRARLIESVLPKAEPIFWLTLLEQVDSLGWRSVVVLNRLLGEADPRIHHYLRSLLKTQPGTRKTILALTHSIRHPGKNDLPIIHDLMKSDDPHIRILSHVAASELEGKPRPWKSLASWILGGKLENQLDRIQALDDLALENGMVLDWVQKNLERRGLPWPLQGALVRVAGNQRHPELAVICRPLVRHKRWQVRLESIEALGMGGRRSALPLLLHALEDDHSRLIRAAGKSLHRLTGRNLGTGLSSWKGYLDLLPADWSPSRLPVAPSSPEAYGPSFYGLSLNSNRVVFVCDLSGSMGGDKLSMLRRELARAIRGFDDKGAFNVVFFHDTVSRLWRRLTPSGEIQKKSAIHRIAQRGAAGGTNIWGGLQRAMNDPNADTICILSDGSPSAGSITSTSGILAATRRINRHQRVVIHTIFVGGGGGSPSPPMLNGFPAFFGSSSFMQQLAQQNEGLHVTAR